MHRDRSTADEESDEAEELAFARASLDHEGNPRSSIRESKRWRRNPKIRWAVDEAHTENPIMSEM